MGKCTDNLTLGEIKELMSIFGNKVPTNDSPFRVGKNYLIRTVTMIILGKLDAVGDKELVLSSASWVADTGRFYDALKTGKLNEVEPFTDDVIVGRGSLIDATIWTHKLPKEQK
jgi:hypothetical protein